MNDSIFSAVPLLVIDTQQNIYTRYLRALRTGRWTSGNPLLPVEVEMLRNNPLLMGLRDSTI